MTNYNLTAEEIAIKLSENVDRSYDLMVETSEHIALRLERLIAQINEGTISKVEIEEEKRRISLLKNNLSSLQRSIAESKEMLETLKEKTTKKRENNQKK